MKEAHSMLQNNNLSGLKGQLQLQSAGIPMVITTVALGYKAPTIVGTLSFLLFVFAFEGTFADKF